MKQNSENWQHSFNHNEMILQSVGEGICVIDKHGNISFANLSAAKMLGWISHELIGKSYKEVLFGSADANSSDEFYAKSSPVEFTLTEGETVHINTETFFCQSAENFLVEYIAVPLLENDEIVGAVITFQDITERREIEVALAEARDAALESAKVKAGFLANMSHEIRTPLNGITGIIELLADTPLSAEQGDYVQIIQKSADLLLNIVNDILDFSRIEAKMLQLEVINFDLNQTVLDTMKLFDAKASKKGISLEVDMDRDVEHVVHGDLGRFRQILNNLVGNAVKFTENGKVIVRVSEQKDSLWRFEVEDTGIGIAPESFAKIFESFSQADISTTRRFGGTGLGLTISKQLVEIMGGKIGVESEIENGSKFWFTVKFEKQTESEEVTPHKLERIVEISPAIKEVAKLRILVAEDNEANKIITRQMLKNIGYEADIVSNGREALEATEINQYDLILMDCLMPEMDGYEATQAIRERENQENPTKIIAVTASSLSDEREKCLRAGMNDFLPKPFTKDDLARLINFHFGFLKSSQTLDSEINIVQHPLLELLDPNILKQFLEIEQNGENAFVSEMIELYLAHSQDQIDKLKEAFAARETKEIHQLVHSLRGSTGNIGFTNLYLQFSDFENLIDKNDWVPAEKSIANILETFAEFKEKSSRIIKTGEV